MRRSCNSTRPRSASYARFQGGLSLLVFLLFAGACGADGSESGHRGSGVARGIESFSSIADKKKLDPCASAAVFLGFSKFKKRDGLRLAEIPYAADDAMDLAHLFSFELDLVCPERVTIIISGKLEKKDSKSRRDQLSVKAKILELDRHEDILDLIKEQASRVEPNGLFIVGFSTHGISIDEHQYLMTPSSSLRKSRESGISLEDVLRIESNAGGRIILVDACRQKLVPTKRSLVIESLPPSAMSPLPNREAPEGQAIFLAAPAGGYAWDDDKRKNGVFTVAVIDSLKECRAEKNRYGHVNLSAVASFAQNSVEQWEKDHEKPKPHGIEAKISQSLGQMPLRICRDEIPPMIGEFLEPISNSIVGPIEILKARVYVPGLYATALVFPLGDGTWWVQNNSRLAFPNADLTIQTSYGGPGRFQVVVALSEDPTLFSRGQRLDQLPALDGEGRRIHYLGPVEVEAVYEQ